MLIFGTVRNLSRIYGSAVDGVRASSFCSLLVPGLTYEIWYCDMF